jgi:6-phosphogluconate dehydrogenase
MKVDNNITKVIKETALECGVSEQVVEEIVFHVFKKTKEYFDIFSLNFNSMKLLQIRYMYFGSFTLNKKKLSKININKNQDETI